MATTSPSKRHLGLTSSTLISTSDVTVGGNLIVNGTTTTLNTATLQVEDKNIELNKGGSAASSNLGGITVLRGTSASAQFIWDQGNTRWDISNGLHVDGEIFTKSHGKSSQWATAYGWGDHADGDYLGNTAKAADSEKLDGLDSTKFLRDNGWNTHPGQDADLQPDQSVDFTYANNAPHSGPLVRIGANNYSLQLNSTYNNDAGGLSYRSYNSDSAQKWNPWRTIYHSGVFTNNSGNWDTAYGWGDHADGGYLTAEADTLDTVADRGASTNQTIKSTNGLGFKVDSSGSARIEIENGGSNWAYLRLRDDTTVSWDIASYNGGNLEWRPGGSETKRMTYSSGGVLSVGDGFTSTKGNTAYGWGNHADAGYVTSSGVETEADPIYTGERDDLRFNKMVHSTLLFDELEDFNKPSGYSTMIQPLSHKNPLPSHGYYHVLGRRDGAGGYGSLLQAYNGHELFHGNTTENTKDINWYNVWTSGDFAKADVTEGATAYSWGDHANAGYIKTLPSHNHDDRYYTEDESDKLFADIDVESHINTAYVDIQVDGNADTYYPVRIQGRGSYAYQRYSVSRRYSWKAPDTWYTASHKGGLTFTFEWSGDTAWGGNHKSIRVVEFHETYSNMLGGIVLPVTGGIMVWLRGGGAQYRLHTPEGRNAGADIEYEAYTAGNGDVYKPRNAEEAATGRTNEVNSKWPVRYSNDLYDDGNRVATQSWSNSQYLGKTAKAADSEKVDGINGASLLRSDAADSFSGILTGTASTENLKIGGIRGTAKGSQTGEYIHLYNRVHIGGPSGWGAASHGAPNHGLSTWGSADFGMNGSGVLQLNGTTFLTKDRLLQNVTNTNWDAAHGWGNHASAGYIKSFDITAQTDSKYLRSNAADTIGSTLTMGTQVALVANNYGRGVFGLYSSTRYQHVWSMGAAYKTADDGTTLGNLYGLAWTHSNNTQGEDIAGLGHQLLCVSNGDTRSAMGDGFWTKYNITTTSYGTAANWKTAYDWGNHADAGYVKQAAVNSSTVDKANGLAEVGYGSDEGTFYQTSGTFAGHTGWANYWIGNHGNGQTYYNTVDIRPFWGVPRYSRQEGTEGVIKGPFDYWTQENFTPSNYSVKSANETLSGSKTFSNSYNEFGNSTGSVSNDGGWNGRVNVAGSSHARLDVKSVSDGIITTMYAHTGHGAGKIGTMSSHPIQFMTGGTTRGQVNSKGVLHMASDIVGFWDFSDRRLKTNIKPLENNLEKVMSLHPVSYQWKEGDRKGRTNIGLIAQEVEEIVPEVVREQERLEEGSTKTYKTVDYEHLVSVLIGAVKEQQEQINELKSKMCKCNGK